MSHFIYIQRWFVDGTVKCFTGGHVALAVFAILVLMMCMALIIIMTAIVLRKLRVCVLDVMCPHVLCP